MMAPVVITSLRGRNRNNLKEAIMSPVIITCGGPENRDVSGGRHYSQSLTEKKMVQGQYVDKSEELFPIRYQI